MSLLNYWPTHEEVDKCVKSEAEALSDEVLLAVHQQFPLAYYKVGPDGKVMANSRAEATEDDLLRHLLGSAPEGSLVVPITGASGVGKSHLIRILDARLRRIPEADRYLVIRIPKSASLRGVVELILAADPLQSPSYDVVRAEFEKALADVPLEEAVILFQAQLKIALRDHAASLEQRLRQDPTNVVIKRQLHVSRGLPQLLGDATTERYFNKEVLPRIIHRAVEGISDESVDINATENQFTAADFNLPDSVDIGRAAVQVRDFYQKILCTMGGEGKALAADVLNDVVDPATSQLYKLNQSLGGKTLGEIIADIRRLLLSGDGNKELIILVEDFAALVGIQDTLAKILIQHGQTDGKKTGATIRSVIAVTDGYLAGKDTLATRAGREWVVESRLESENESLRRAGLLVASYINAARHGEEALKEYYRQTGLVDPKSGKEIAPPVFSDDVGDSEEILESFGRVSGIPLFPFTGEAIECLVRSTLTTGSELTFNPRFIIKNVIRDVLISGRDAFSNDQFPPPGISGKPLAAEVAQWLASLGFSPELSKRYERLISIWGNNPSRRSDVGRIPKQVFAAFHLQPPALDVHVDKRIEKKKELPSTPSAEVTDRRVKKIQDYEDALERWVQEGSTLEQKVANAIRQSLEKLINQRIDWNAERCQKRDIRADRFSIPNAGGEAGLAAETIKVADSSDDPTGQLRGELLALLRFNEYEGKSDYDDADEDLARVSNLVDRLLPSALLLLRSSNIKQTKATISLLAANSRLLGLTERGRTPGAVSSFLFGEVSEVSELYEDAPVQFRDWRALQKSAYMAREQLKQLVLETTGCFQGVSGKTAYGVDIVRLIECFADESGGDVFADIPGIPPSLKQELMPMRQAPVVARRNQVLKEAKKTQDFVESELGAEFDKSEIISLIKDVALKLKEAGAWKTDVIGKSPKEFENLCEVFRNSAVKEALAILQDAVSVTENEPSPVGLTINKVAQLPLEALLVTNQFLAVSNKVIDVAAAHAKVLEVQHGGITPDQKAAELLNLFNKIEADIGSLK